MLNEGDKFGKYTIVKRIGIDEEGNSKGAFATVYVVSYKEREFVLKIPNNTEKLDNLFREIGNWAKVSLHPNILTYYETVTDSGKIGFISEYIQSGSLKDWLKNSKHLDISQKLLLIDGILSGLEHLHENLILHRDLKPDNIFVKDDIPLLADFGSAKDYDFAEMQYAYGFTYRYAPPELVALYDDFGAGAKYQITKFDDLWSVSIIICEILTGQYPFARMSKIIEGEMRPFPQNTDPWIIDFIQRALQKDRLNRFQTVKEMRAALKDPQPFAVEKAKETGTVTDEDFDENEKGKIEPAEEGRKVENPKPVENKSESLLPSIEAKRQQADLSQINRDLENKKRPKSDNQIWFGAGLIFLIAVFFIVIIALSSPNSDVTNKPANKPANNFITTPTPVADNPKSSKNYFDIAYACYVKQDYDCTIQNYNKSIELNPTDENAYNNRGLAFHDKGNYDQAISDFNKAIELKSDFTQAYNNRGRSNVSKRNYDQAISDCSKAIELNPAYAEAYNNRGNAYADERNYDQAISDYNKSIELKPFYESPYNGRGTVYEAKGNYDQAITEYRKAIQLNPNYLNAKNNLERVLKKKGG